MEIREARPQPGAVLPAVLPGDRSRVEEGLDRDGDAPDGPCDPYTRGHDAPADEEAAGRGEASGQADDDGDADHHAYARRHPVRARTYAHADAERDQAGAA